MIRQPSGVVDRSGVVAADFDDRFEDLFRVGYRAAFAIVGVRADAEDCAQESLVRAFDRWPKVEPYANAWVARVSANLAIDRTKRRPRHSTAVPPASADELVDQREAVVSALRQLPARQREAVVLRFLVDLSEADVARAMGCSVGTVKSATSRGLEHLRTRLGREQEATS